MTLTGAPSYIHRPIEARRYWGCPKKQKTLVDGIHDGSKAVLVYDPTQRITDVDPDIEAMVRGHGRDIPGETLNGQVTWVGPSGEAKLVKNLLILQRARPQDLLFRLASATKRQELDARYAKIEPENWRDETKIRITFHLERPRLETLRKVEVGEFKTRFDPRIPTFAETDGACAGNEDKQSPGGWGAILCQDGIYCTMFDPQPDTSNIEMEYKAMLEAISIIPRNTYVIFETDSQGCIDGLTKYRKRWESRGWHNDQGKPVANAEIIGPLARLIDQHTVGFRKIKGHSHDERNDLADSSAVQGRNQQSQQVTIQLLFRAVIDREEKFYAFDRVHIEALANLRDFWKILSERCEGDFGAPEDHEIWHRRKVLSKELVTGEQYEIIAKRTPGKNIPIDISRQRRNSIDLSKEPEAPLQAVPKALKYTPEKAEQRPKSLGTIPPDWSAQVTFQLDGQPDFTWEGWFNKDDTEESILLRAKKEKNVRDAVRRRSFWADKEGIRLVVTNKRKTIPLKYTVEDVAEPEEVEISVSETPRSLLDRLRYTKNSSVIDDTGRRFHQADSLFTFGIANPEAKVNIRQGISLKATKERPRSAVEDKRVAIAVQFGDREVVLARKQISSHLDAYESAREQLRIAEDDWRGELGRAEDDRIYISCQRGVKASWMHEKAFPPLLPKKYPLLKDSNNPNLGIWAGKPSLMTTTRSSAKAKPLRVFLRLDLNEVFEVGKVATYDEVLPLVRRECNITRADEENVMVACQQGAVKVTPDLQKRKYDGPVRKLPAKLIAEGSGIERRTLTAPPLKAPGEIGQIIPARVAKEAPIRRDHTLINLRVHVEGEGLLEARVQSNATIEEIIGAAFSGRAISEIESFGLAVNPPTMMDGATFRFGRRLRPHQVRLIIEFQNWDDERNLLTAAIEGTPMMTLNQIFEKFEEAIGIRIDGPAHYRIIAANAMLGKSRHQAIYCVRAVGSSQGAELDASEVWSVQGRRGTCVTGRHPPPNLGRNLFPPRRFSYHTRVSGFNGTARQP
jgi:ribonuclease HI